MKKTIFLFLVLASTSVFAQTMTTTDSATAARYMAGAGFDYEGKNVDGTVKNVPTAPKVINNDPNTVNLGGGSHTVDIIDKKNTAMPSLKQKEMPKIPEKPERYRGGIDYAPPKTKPVSVLPKTPGQPSGKALPEPNSLEPWKDVPKFGPQSDEPTPATRKIQENTVIRDPSLIKPKWKKQEQQDSVASQQLAEQKAVQPTNQQPVTPQAKPDGLKPESQQTTHPVMAKPHPVDPNLPTGPSIRTKEMPLPGQEPLNVDKGVTQPAKQPITDRAAGAHEIFELHEGNAIQKSKPLNESAGRWTKPLKEDDWKYPEKPVQPTAEQEKQVSKQKPVATKQKPQKEPEQKTVIKKMDPNKKWGEFKPIYPPSESAQKIKKMDTSKWKKKDPFATSKSMKIKPTDPFATSQVLDGKYESKPVGGGEQQQYGGNEDDLLRMAAANKKANRIERERIEAEERARAQAQADAADAMFVNGLVNVGMYATMNHYTKPKHVSGGGGGGGKPADVYRRGYADEKYGGGNYNTPHSEILEGAKGMRGGGSAGWQ